MELKNIKFMNTAYKHLKLQKFVSGNKQRIFKTNTDITYISKPDELSASTYIQKGKQKNIYYGNYFQENVDYISSNLIDFHQINYDYFYKRPDRIKFNNIYSDRNNPIFAMSANVIKNYTTEQDGQRISYFPQYMYTPLDISKYNNSYYMLLPINTDRYINIVHSDKIVERIDELQEKPFGELISSNIYDRIPYKNNYTEMISSFYQRAAYTSEDNNIPIYDLNFTNIQTIKFESSEAVFQWIIKWGFENIIYKKGDTYVSLLSQILYDSINQKFYDEKQKLDNYDSIYLKNLLDYLVEKYYLYSSQTISNIIIDLLNNLNKESINKFFNPIGRINSINKNLLEAVLTGKFKQDLNKQNLFNLRDLLTKQQESVFSQNTCLPQNTLLVGNSQYPLYISENKYDFPSCYVNLLHLKNSKNPEYQYDYELYDLLSTNVRDYIILNSGYISSVIDDNSLYEFDGRFTVEFNNGSIKNVKTLNKNITQDIINNAIIKDNQLSQNSGYVYYFPRRMAIKELDYMNQYNNKHIIHNKIYKDVGTLKGFRNYLKTNTNYNNKSWLSYRYNSSNDNNTVFIQQFKLPFEQYSLKREQQWITDIYNKNLSTYIMKNAEKECPWTQKLQNYMGCNLSLNMKCDGFCTFPCNKKMKSINNNIFGLTWNSNNFTMQTNNKFNDEKNLNNNLNLNITNHQFYIIPSAEFDRQLIAKTDIQINDDIQIFFVSGIYDDISFKNIIKNISIEKQMKAIFNGFGKDSLNPDISYPEILYKNQINLTNYKIAENSNFNGPHIITKNTKLAGYNLNTNQVTNIVSKGQFVLIKIKNWWSNTIKCTGIIETNIINKENYEFKQSQILNILNNYQYIETLDGFYKFKQKGLHKSNIYSINLANTGLNPANDKQIQYYTKNYLINKFQQKYYIKYYQQDDNFLIATDQNVFLFTRYYSHHNDNILCKTPLFKELYKKYDQSNFNDLKGFILWLKTISFNELVIIQGLASIYNEQTNETLYYYPEDMNKIKEYNEIRINLRELFEKAIKESLNKYMPADTTLWKIKYSGE